jgi:hypothetical protein
MTITRDLIELAQVTLSARAMSRRVGLRYVLDHDRLQAMGYSMADLRRVETVVNDIERHTDAAIRSLGQSLKMEDQA